MYLFRIDIGLNYGLGHYQRIKSFIKLLKIKEYKIIIDNLTDILPLNIDSEKVVALYDRESSFKNETEDAKILAKKHDFSTEEILLGEGALQTETERYKDAFETYSIFINQFPESIHFTDALIGKAHAAYTLQDYQSAITAYQQILPLSG